MRDVLPEIEAWRERGDRIALATVVGVKRSAPRAPGAKMAVSSSGEIAGGVSGGCVEGAVVEVAEQPSLHELGTIERAALPSSAVPATLPQPAHVDEEAVAVPAAWSDVELLRHKDFAQYTDTEMAAARSW